MVPHKLCFIGAQLLFLSHIAQSFILLTANMEDVKKIARKFVSDSLAEKIAEFVAKATDQMAPNVSEENEQNVEYHNISDDNEKLQNIGRQRIEKTTKTNKDYSNREFKQTSRRTEYEKASTTQHDWNTEKIVNTGQNINWEKEDNDISYEKYSKKEEEKSKQDYDQVKPDRNQPTHDYDRSKPDFTQPKADYDQTKHNLDQPKSQYKQWKPDYEQTKHDFDQPKHEYEELKHDLDQPKHEYEHSKQDYEQPKQDFNLPKHDYDQPIKNYEQSKHDFVQPKHNYKQLKSAKKLKLRPHKSNQKIILKELRRPAPEQETSRFNQNDQDSNYPNKNDRENKYQDQNALKSVRLSSLRPIDSTILYAGKSLLDDIPAPSLKRAEHRGHRLTAFDSTEAKPEEAVLNSTALPSTLRGFNIQRALTTQKERTEFDQYDNPKYPKAEFIATSGPVALPKVLMQTPWWEKEMPGDKDKDKKLWF